MQNNKDVSLDSKIEKFFKKMQEDPMPRIAVNLFAIEGGSVEQIVVDDAIAGVSNMMLKILGLKAKNFVAKNHGQVLNEAINSFVKMMISEIQKVYNSAFAIKIESQNFPDDEIKKLAVSVVDMAKKVLGEVSDAYYETVFDAAKTHFLEIGIATCSKVIHQLMAQLKEDELIHQADEKADDVKNSAEIEPKLIFQQQRKESKIRMYGPIVFIEGDTVRDFVKKSVGRSILGMITEIYNLKGISTINEIPFLSSMIENVVDLCVYTIMEKVYEACESNFLLKFEESDFEPDKIKLLIEFVIYWTEKHLLSAKKIKENFSNDFYAMAFNVAENQFSEAAIAICTKVINAVQEHEKQSEGVANDQVELKSDKTINHEHTEVKLDSIELSNKFADLVAMQKAALINNSPPAPSHKSKFPDIDLQMNVLKSSHGAPHNKVQIKPKVPSEDANVAPISLHSAAADRSLVGATTTKRPLPSWLISCPDGNCAHLRETRFGDHIKKEHPDVPIKRCKLGQDVTFNIHSTQSAKPKINMILLVSHTDPDDSECELLFLIYLMSQHIIFSQRDPGGGDSCSHEVNDDEFLTVWATGTWPFETEPIAYFAAQKGSVRKEAITLMRIVNCRNDDDDVMNINEKLALSTQDMKRLTNNEQEKLKVTVTVKQFMSQI